MLTNEELSWIKEEGCKKFTAKELGDKYGIENVRMCQILKKNGITPIKARERLKVQLQELFDNGEFHSYGQAGDVLGVNKKTVEVAATELGLEPKSITDINNDINPKKEDINETRRLVEIAIKTGFITSKSKRYYSFDEKKSHIKSMFSTKERISDKYTQTGSELLDDLRGIKTTKRENTLLSNGDVQ